MFCLVPIYDLISTHCRKLFNDDRIHLRLWRMLTNVGDEDEEPNVFVEES